MYFFFHEKPILFRCDTYLDNVYVCVCVRASAVTSLAALLAGNEFCLLL